MSTTATEKRKRRPARLEAVDACVVRALSQQPLSHQAFAEKYIKIATGPYKGHPFRVSRQPFTGLLFRELDSGRWPEVYVTGPSQSSKTLSGFVIPTLRDIKELRENVLIGVPEADMASDKWDTDFMPTLKASPALWHLIPQSGPGSKGGRVRDRVTLDGIEMKIMSRGGQDTAKAGFTARRVRVTEAAGFSKSGEASAEADPLRQLKARMRAFKRRFRSLIVEGTMTVPEELPARARGLDDDEALISTRSRIVSPCPHCGVYVCPQREHLVGWQDAESEQQACDQACFVCPECGMAVNDDQRRASMAECRLVHWGQEVDPSGRIIGEPPPTPTLWFQWHAWHNTLLDAADTAADEWKAAQLDEGTVDRENAEKELCQFAHGVTFKSTLAENEILNAQVVRKRTNEWKRNVLPADTQWLTIGVDVGKWSSWWFAIAHRESGGLHVPAYGAFDVMRDANDDLTQRILQSLREFNDNVVMTGFPVEGSDGMRLPDGVGIDIGYQPDDIAVALREFGGSRWHALYGRGSSLRRFGKVSGGYNHPKQLSLHTPMAGNRWHAKKNFERRLTEKEFDADYWLLRMHDRLRAKVDSPAAMTFYQADMKNEHAKVAIHLTAEHLEKTWDQTKGGLVEKWVKTAENHYGDAAKMAMVTCDIVTHIVGKRKSLENRPTMAQLAGKA